ncbi:MAG: S-methyl-5'-thioadenosine phosphorylase [Thermodesulfovibrionales bacterium]
MPKVGVIAGSGFYEIEGVTVREFKKMKTPYGEPSDIYRICEMSGIEFAFLSRHGTPHHIPPHRINYRANIWAFKELGVERILSINAAGGINREMKPGDIIMPDQIIDMTHGRPSTFYDGDEVVHVDFTMPYCPELRDVIINAGRKADTGLIVAGTYICVNGPRLETKAEIRFFADIGADIVGMTVMPEACLARELEICFAGIAVVTNYAAGISDRRLTTTEVVENMKAATERIKCLLRETLKTIPEKRACGCKDALKEASM